MADTEVLVFNKMFTKWFIDDYGTNKIPEYFASRIYNLRIVNWWVKPRPWQQLIYEFTDGEVAGWGWPVTVYLVVANGNLGKLYCVAQEWSTAKFYDVDPSWWWVTALGTFTGIAFDTTSPPRAMTYGSYTIILTWQWAPRYWDGSTWWQSSWSEIDSGVNPSFWAVFWSLTFINRADKPNYVIASRPIDVTNPWYCKDRKWSWSQSIPVRGKVQWMFSSLNRLRIFTDRTIEYISADNLTSTWWVTEIYTTPAFRWEPLPNPDVISWWGDTLFYITSRKDIRVIWYEGNVIEPQVKSLVSIENAWITRYMQEDADVTYAFSYWDSKRNLIKNAIIEWWSVANNVVLLWDISNNTWLRDTNKFSYWPSAAQLSERIFVNYWSKIIEDEVGGVDNTSWADTPISWWFITQDLALWDPIRPKQYRDTVIAWQIGNNSTFTEEIFVDNVSVFSDTITWAPGDVEDFEKATFIRKDGKKIRYEFTWSWANQEIILDFLSQEFKRRARYRREDREFDGAAASYLTDVDGTFIVDVWWSFITVI